MIDKITYDNGIIRSGFDTFHCDDDKDMERLCSIVNTLFLEKAIKSHNMETQLFLIENVLKQFGNGGVE